ncbi:MAG: hypothetical protein ACREPX_03735 [Rhodanobacteraceae bacterium]
MTNRLIPVLLLTATVYAFGASVVAFSYPAHMNLPHAAPVAVAQAMTVLPTIVVRPELETTLMPTVTVRPTAADIAAAAALDSEALRVGAVVVALHAAGGGMLPRSSFDMPYYSFGKTTYRVSKE